MPSDRVERAAELIERLTADPAYRARFLADPAAVLDAGGLPDVAAEIQDAPRALQTLEQRESRSSLAGALFAAAVEGAAVLHGGGRGGGEGAQALQTAAARRAVRVDPSHHGRPIASAVSARGGAADWTAALHGYPGDRAGRPAVAAWMAAAAARAGLPRELPVMAALVESNLRNAPGGDRDSVGYFQMRLMYWNSGRYAGYPHDPRLQLRWFIDHALAVRAKEPWVASKPEYYGRWIADVEQCDARFRGRYQLQLNAARSLLAAGGGQAQAAAAAAAPSAGRHPRDRSADGAPAPAAPYDDRPLVRNTVAHARAGRPARAALAEAGSGQSRGASVRAHIVAIARHEIGVAETSDNNSPRIAQYRTATAGDPGPGAWCAYFVSWVARRAGVPLGDHGQGYGAVDDVWAWAQHAGRAVTVASGARPRPGDLIVFPEHIGIVERVMPDGTLRTIEGNYSDRVAEVVRRPSEAIGFVRMGR